MFNKKISKGNTKTLFYRDYKKFEENNFTRDLTHELQNPSKKISVIANLKKHLSPP